MTLTRPTEAAPVAGHRTVPKVFVPHTATGLRDETIHAVAGQPDIQFVLLEGDEAYWLLWATLWACREDVVVVEQDIVPHHGVFDEFRDCPEPWCAYPYHYAHFGLYAGTGCVRFRAELLRNTPTLIDLVGGMSDRDHPPRHWCRLDGWMQQQLHDAGYRQHRHEPPVTHLGVGVSHGCC